jgi:hypothetical protein
MPGVITTLIDLVLHGTIQGVDDHFLNQVNDLLGKSQRCLAQAQKSVDAFHHISGSFALFFFFSEMGSDDPQNIRFSPGSFLSLSPEIGSEDLGPGNGARLHVYYRQHRKSSGLKQGQSISNGPTMSYYLFRSNWKFWPCRKRVMRIWSSNQRPTRS